MAGQREREAETSRGGGGSHPKGDISRTDEYRNTMKIRYERYDRGEDNAKETTKNGPQTSENEQKERGRGSPDLRTTGVPRTAERGRAAARASVRSREDEKTSKTSAQREGETKK